MNVEELRKNLSSMQHEAEQLMFNLDSKELDPTSPEYRDIRKSFGDLETRIRETQKLILEHDKLEYEHQKLMHEIEADNRRLAIEERHSENEMTLERERLGTEEKKCKSNEKVALWTMIGTSLAAIVPAGIQLVGNMAKYKTGERVIETSTRQAFELDQEKVQSRVASDTSKRGIDMFFNR